MQRQHDRIRLLVVVMAALFPFAVFMVVQAFDIKQRRIAEALDQAGQLAKLSALRYKDVIDESKRLTNTVADVTVLSIAFNCSPTLNALQSIVGWLDGIFLIDRSGTVRCSTVDSLRGVNLGDRPEVREGFESGEMRISEGFIAPRRNMPLVVLTKPTTSFFGEPMLVAASINLAWFDQLAEGAGLSRSAEVLLIDRSGTILSAMPKARGVVGSRLPAGALWDKMMSATEGRYEIADAQGTARLLGFASVEGSELKLAISLPKSMVVADIDNDFVRAMFAFVAVTVVASLIIWNAGLKVFVDPLARLSKLLQTTLSNMDQGVIVADKSGVIRLCNDRARQLLDFDREILDVDVNIRSVLEHQQRRGDFKGLPQHLMELVRGGLPKKSIYERDADDRTLEIRTVPLEDGGLVRTYSDITDRRAQDRSIAASEARHRAIAEHSSDLILQLTGDGIILFASAACISCLGDILGRRLHSLIDAGEIGGLSDALTEVDQTGSAAQTIRVRDRNGHAVWLEGRLTRLPGAQGSPQAVLAIYRDITARKAAEDALRQAHEAMELLARSDGLTGLANRRAFDDALAKEHARARREFKPLSLLLVDLDHFKKFNDAYGHLAGDDCLKRIAATLQAAARRPGDLAVRYGGEEFALILPATDAAGAWLVASGVVDAIRDLNIAHDASPRGVITASVGCATYNCDLGEPQELLRQADAALYRAKNQGRNTVSEAPPTVRVA